MEPSKRMAVGQPRLETAIGRRNWASQCPESPGGMPKRGGKNCHCRGRPVKMALLQAASPSDNAPKHTAQCRRRSPGYKPSSQPAQGLRALRLWNYLPAVVCHGVSGGAPRRPAADAAMAIVAGDAMASCHGCKRPCGMRRLCGRWRHRQPWPATLPCPVPARLTTARGSRKRKPGWTQAQGAAVALRVGVPPPSAWRACSGASKPWISTRQPSLAARAGA